MQGGPNTFIPVVISFVCGNVLIQQRLGTDADAPLQEKYEDSEATTNDRDSRTEFEEDAYESGDHVTTGVTNRSSPHGLEELLFALLWRRSWFAGCMHKVT